MVAIKRSISLVIVFIVGCVSLCSCVSREIFHKWKAESKSMPYAFYGSVTLENKEYINLQDCFREDDFIYEVFVIYNSYIYYLCSGNKSHDDSRDKFTWDLVSVNMNNTDEVKICYSGEFGDVNDNSSRYNLVHTGNYEDKSGFYYDGKIILKDESRLVEYDIESEDVTEYNPGDYKYPQNDYHYTVQEDYQSILLTNSESGYEKLITIDDMADSTYGEDLLELRQETTWNKDTLKTDRFFQNVQFINGEVYLRCDVFNRGGNRYALIFKYDIERDEYIYVQECNIINKVINDFYLIEKVDTQ